MRVLLSCWPNQVIGDNRSRGREMWLMILVAICEAIWEERNKRTFEGTMKEHCCIIDDILAKIHGWLFLAQARETPPFKDWIFDWISFLY